MPAGAIMKFDSHSPLIGIPVCARDLDGHPFHMVGEKYITGVGLGAGGLPMLIPALGDAFDPPRSRAPAGRAAGHRQPLQCRGRTSMAGRPTGPTARRIPSATPRPCR